jgi:hypothetical protein
MTLNLGLSLRGKRGAGGGPTGVTSVTMGGVTFSFSEPVQAGLDQTGRAYVVDPGAGVTVTAISPAQTTDAGNVINGAQKNFAIGEAQGLDQRFTAATSPREGQWSALQNDTVPISLVAGDKLIKVVSDLTGSIGDRDGSISEFACLHCVTTAPTVTQVLGPSLTWSGDTTPEVYNFDLNAFYAARTTRSSANISWFNFAAQKAQLGRLWPTLGAINATNFDRGYENFSPRGFGRDATLSNANYGVYIATSLGDLMLATTVAAGGAFTEAQIKDAILIALMHGIEWGIPLAYSGTQLGSDGGHYQFHPGPSIFALNALGLSAKIPDLMTDAGGNYGQAFQIASVADFAPHTDQFKPWFARERTLSTQPGGSTITLPFNIPGYASASGFDIRRDAAMPVGTRIVRKSDGATVTTSATFSTPDTAGNPVSLNVSLTATNTLASGDVVTMLPPVAEPLQVGSYDWAIQGYFFPNAYSPAATATYRALQAWGGALMTLLSHGITPSSLNAPRGYYERSRRTNDPSATNDYGPAHSNIAEQYYAENWQPGWSILSAPSAFVVGNWTLASNGNVSISALPNNGGLTITSIEYRLNGGSWAAASGITEFSVVNGRTITFTIPSYAGQDVEIRAVNAIGGGAASDVKVASFAPASLFAASEQGGWYDPSDLSTMWKDTAGTDPVTADGDLVARIDDKSGNGNHLTQATSGNRPTYKTSGGLHWLEFNGTSQAMSTPSAFNLSASDKLTIWMGLRRDQDTTGTVLLELSANWSSNAGSFYVSAPDDATKRLGIAARGSAAANANQSATVGAVSTAPDNCVLTATHDIAGDLSKIWRNRTAGTDGTGDKGTGNFASAQSLFLGARNLGSFRFTGRVYSLIIRGGTSTSGQIADAEAWIAAKSGVTL